MSNENLKQLIVLGNGFDLYCGLRSSFNDFFTPRKKQLNKILEENIIKSQKLNELDNIDNVVTKWKEAGLTAWDIILSSPELSRLTSESNWCDIESAIANFIQPSQQNQQHIANVTLDESISSYPGLSLDIHPNLDLLDKARKHPNLIEKKESYKPNTFGNLLHDAFGQDKGYDLYTYICKNYPRNENIHRIALKELYTLEKQFKNYLEQKTNENHRYNKITGLFVLFLIFSHIGIKDISLSILDSSAPLSTSILNFNYTFNYMNTVLHHPKVKPELVDKINMINIHGKLNKEVIFGIDGSEYMFNPNIAPFTKTYRIMKKNIIKNHIALKAIEQIKRPQQMEQNVKILQNFDVIKFFGHSLARADYSYFQSIFDFVNLYSGNTKLVFYYVRYGGKDDLTAKTEMLDRVINLLTDYGQTLDNKDHGKNLIHKLLLEGRLSVSYLPFISELAPVLESSLISVLVHYQNQIINENWPYTL